MAEQACRALAKTWKYLHGAMDRIKQEKPTLHRLIFVCAGGMLAGTAALVTIFVLLIGTPIFLLFLPLLVPLGILAVLFIDGILVFVLARSSPLAWLLEVATFGAEAMIHIVTGNFVKINLSNFFEIFTGNVGSHVASIVTNAAGGVKNVAVAVSEKTSQAVGGVAGTAMAITSKASSVIATCVVETAKNTGKALEIGTTAVTGGVLELGSSVTGGALELASSVAGGAIGLGLSVTGTVTELGSNVPGGLAGLFHPSGDKSSSRKKKNTGSERHS
ncbi:hypothetical protein SELMODRAFT_424788 [Selaginella moellendorffii]|uniref:Oleosin n=1 Tax=Selaginella moellendorffii TaxID=88036 RepID=D8SR11_SELML|nr:hypothetical protein SELMODRAFT_424788 [Selaginella moellendorffii]